MKFILHIGAIILTIWIFLFLSCKKEYSCEGCADKNKPPIAVAGPDKVITLPTDSVLLDGNSSSDPDGTITKWLWTKISGPASFNIIRQSDSATKLKALIVGSYLFELKVTDNGGVSAKDSVQVIVNDLSQPTNRPPVANAGADQTITLPTNSTTLNGNGTTDPDNNISSYAWTKISGPTSFNIANASAVQTQVTNLLQGVYQFELKVIDAGGLSSKDTIHIIINPALPTTIACYVDSRPLISAQLIPIGTLSQWRSDMSIASANNKILFAGGNNFTENPGYIYSTVDIYDISTNSWSTASLSQQQSGMGVAVLGNKIFFAGGYANPSGSPTVICCGSLTSRVNIYDATSNTWSTAELSEPRYSVKGGSAGNKVLFAGGNKNDYDESARVDIYDAATNLWAIAMLSQERRVASSTTIGNKIYFAGGKNLDGVDTYGSLSRIDIYDVSSNIWSIQELNQPRDYMAGISVGDKNYWAGGDTLYWNNTNSVEIREANESTSIFECLFQSNAAFDAVLKDNKIVFFTGGGVIKNKFDIYNITTNTWSIGVLPVNVTGASIISVNNTIYVAGGFINGVASTQVWKLEF